MIVPMTRARIVCRAARLEELLTALYDARLVQLDATADGAVAALGDVGGVRERESRREQLRLLLAELDGLLDLAGAGGPREARAAPVDAAAVRREVRELAPRVEELARRLDALRAEDVVLGRYVGLLRHLLDLLPELRLLDTELAALRLGTIALVLNTEETSVVELLREELEELLGRRFLLAAAPVEGRALGCVLVVPAAETSRVHELLGRQRVRHVPLPDAYRELSLGATVAAMEARRKAIPPEEASVREELDVLVGARARSWRSARAALAAQVDQLDAARLARATERTAVVEAWLPRGDLAGLEAALLRSLGPEVVVEEAAGARADRRAPVLLANRRPARPFELIVRVYDDPRARSLDPTGLVALFLPLMFGLMVGDVVYGALLLAGALVVRRRLGPRSPAVRDLTGVLALGSAWAIVFGIVFGEALGDLGERAFGMPALWLHRDDEEAVQALLLLALAIGAAHVTLGLVLGLWQAWRDRLLRGAVAQAGTLLALGGLFTLAGAAAGRLPEAAAGLGAAVAIVGLVLVSAVHGALGLLLGPLELVGVVGNVLSYLRLGAVGLASVYLAVVANELATVGPIWMGVLVAAFLHALNLALAGFTPAIQAVRLQYVEFFTKFFVGGGRAFRPFGSNAGPAPGDTAPAEAGAR